MSRTWSEGEASVVDLGSRDGDCSDWLIPRTYNDIVVLYFIYNNPLVSRDQYIHPLVLRHCNCNGQSWIIECITCIDLESRVDGSREKVVDAVTSFLFLTCDAMWRPALSPLPPFLRALPLLPPSLLPCPPPRLALSCSRAKTC